MIMTICWALLVLSTFIYIRAEVTYRNQRIIGDAVYRYSMDMIDKDMFIQREVFFDDIESFERTMFRLWDFGYTRILPPDKFEIIRPYIKER